MENTRKESPVRTRVCTDKNRIYDHTQILSLQFCPSGRGESRPRGPDPSEMNVRDYATRQTEEQFVPWGRCYRGSEPAQDELLSIRKVCTVPSEIEKTAWGAHTQHSLGPKKGTKKKQRVKKGGRLVTPNGYIQRQNNSKQVARQGQQIPGRSLEAT